jgi:hypothetical protein
MLSLFLLYKIGLAPLVVFVASVLQPALASIRHVLSWFVHMIPTLFTSHSVPCIAAMISALCHDKNKEPTALSAQDVLNSIRFIDYF